MKDDKGSGRSPDLAIAQMAIRDGFDSHSDIFFAAVETTRMPMIVTDPHQPDNPIVFANVAFLKMTGYGLDELIGRNCRFLQGRETDRGAVDDVRQAVAEQREIATEILNYRKDGSTFWNALFISPVRDTAGKVVYFFASQLDVSRRRDAEKALHQAQKMEALGQLTGGIAHDFNNLLQVISGYADVMESLIQRPGYDESRMSRALGNVRLATDKASRLTHQLLAFSRKQRLEGRLINLNNLVGAVGEMADRTLGDHVRFAKALAPDLWNVRIDPTQAEVSLLNVLINARDAMPDGGLVTVETANVRAGPEAQGIARGVSPGKYVLLTVNDTGAGMTPEVLARVMEPFFTTKEEGKGTGLGLATVYGFVKQSGGTVTIDSEPGRGTTVRMLFPASETRGETSETRILRTSERQGTETILVVDDRAEVAETAREFLLDHGYTVHVALDPQTALRMMDDGLDFDLLFSDLVMPGMNGVALARAMRERKPGLKVLLTTGYAEASLERTDAGGADFDIIDKPYRRLDFVRRIRQVLEGPTGVG